MEGGLARLEGEASDVQQQLITIGQRLQVVLLYATCSPAEPTSQGVDCIGGPLLLPANRAHSCGPPWPLLGTRSHATSSWLPRPNCRMPPPQNWGIQQRQPHPTW